MGFTRSRETVRRTVRMSSAAHAGGGRRAHDGGDRAVGGRAGVGRGAGGLADRHRRSRRCRASSVANADAVGGDGRRRVGGRGLRRGGARRSSARAENARAKGRMAAPVPRITESAPRCSGDRHPRGRPAASCARSRTGRAAPSSSSTRARWQSSSAPTSTCADSAGKPDVTSHTCRSWTSRDAVHADHRRADLVHVDAPSAPPRGRSARSRAAGTTRRAASPPRRTAKRSRPRGRTRSSRITRPAIAVAMNATRSVSTCWNAPSTFKRAAVGAVQHHRRRRR